MTPERWREIKRIFDAAADLAPREQHVFLDSVCPDPTTRVEIERMLAADLDTALDESPLAALAPDDDPASLVGRRIGRYRITGEIARGGMGAVFSAVRDDGEFQQQAAVKLIKSGLHTEAIARRFRHERQILASLEHPNIARLLDGGVTDDGLPFYVMEFVGGAPVDDYCRERDLSLKDRLELFRQICGAVAYAHRRLIVHRDLKPSNILVTPAGEVKLLDFGIAKVISQTIGGARPRGTATQLGLMTPDYASPEQFRGEQVTTATDVYSLGVVLYELLTGARPYDLTGLRLDEMLRAVCETGPPRPSQAIADCGLRIADSRPKKRRRASPSSSSNPQSAIHNPQSKNPQLKGDLDNIILKALRKEPENRYASVEALSEDIGRHLKGLPIVARPATFGYRAGKFVRRNRPAVLLASLVLLTLVGGISATGWQAVRAERERKLAQKRFEQSRDLANSLVFKYHDAIANLPNSSPVRELLLKDASAYLDNLARDAGGDLTLLREVALARTKLGDIQGRPHGASLGNTAGAIENYEAAAALFETVARGSTRADRPRATGDLLTIYQKLGSALTRAKERPERRRELLNQRIEMLGELLREQPGDLKLRIELADTHTSVGNRLLRADFDEGHRYYQQNILPTLAEAERIAPDAGETLALKTNVLSKLGWHFAEQGRLLIELEAGADAARPYFGRALELFQETAKVYERQYRREPSNHIGERRFKSSICNIGIHLGDAGRVEESYGYLKRCLDDNLTLAAFDANDVQAVFDTGDAYNSLAVYHRRRQDFARAFAHYELSLAHMERVIAADAKHHEAINYKLDLLTQIGNTHAEALRLNVAQSFYERAAEFAARSLTAEPGDRVLAGAVRLNAGRAYATFAGRETSREAARALWQKSCAELRRAADITAAARTEETPKRLRVIERQLAKCERALA